MSTMQARKRENALRTSLLKKRTKVCLEPSLKEHFVENIHSIEQIPERCLKVPREQV
jgi:hypothetical protein